MAVVLVGTLPFLFRPASVPLDDALQLLPGRIGDWTIDTVSKPVAVRFPALDNELLHAYPAALAEHRFTEVDDDLVREYRSPSGERVRLYIGYYRDQQHGKELIGDLSHALRAAASPLELVLPTETIEINQVVPGDQNPAGSYLLVRPQRPHRGRHVSGQSVYGVGRVDAPTHERRRHHGRVGISCRQRLRCIAAEDDRVRAGARSASAAAHAVVARRARPQTRFL